MLVIKAFLWLVSCVNLHHFSLFYNFYFADCDCESVGKQACRVMMKMQYCNLFESQSFNESSMGDAKTFITLEKLSDST